MEHPMPLSEAVYQTAGLIRKVRLPVDAVEETDLLRTAVNNLDVIFGVLKQAEEESLRKNDESEGGTNDPGPETD